MANSLFPLAISENALFAFGISRSANSKLQVIPLINLMTYVSIKRLERAICLSLRQLEETKCTFGALKKTKNCNIMMFLSKDKMKTNKFPKLPLVITSFTTSSPI